VQAGEHPDLPGDPADAASAEHPGRCGHTGLLRAVAVEATVAREDRREATRIDGVPRSGDKGIVRPVRRPVDR
jgi:hypothetical protein